MAEFNRRKKKVCMMCTKNAVVDYKDPETLKRYTNEKGKIVPRRVTGNCAEHQRVIAKEVKKARFMGILPYTNAN